ncbi:hypothetical protein FJ492_11055 [Mesorhizobium sp. B2-5-4]|nr:hypothetical protein FJ434_11425 [Mesorhizobium sp. B2-5-13]TPK44785.1 hypothetical protein FJ492_11055 [Mesorhizobium sp. B2-5-4]TPK52416.1 hypothetical protein FJ560_06840 [Mesorhizobium sp. B2-5-5]
MLAQARERGIVQIRINSKVANCIELENRLRHSYGVSDPIVVPTPPDPALLPQVIAAAAGQALSLRIRDGISVGVGWGRTLQLSLRSVTVRPVKGMSVVSLLGGLTRGSAISIYEMASRLAALYDADCFYIAAPVFTDTEATRDLLMRQSILEDAFSHARDVDAAFVSVGAVHKDATISDRADRRGRSHIAAPGRRRRRYLRPLDRCRWTARQSPAQPSCDRPRS